MAEQKWTTTKRHINDLRHGDTVLHRGELVTVSVSNLRRRGFMGATLLGDSYRLGTEPVIVADVLWRRQGQIPAGVAVPRHDPTSPRTTDGGAA